MNKLKNYALIGLILLTAASSNAFAQQPEMYRPNDTNRQSRQINYRLPFFDKAQLIDVEIVGGKIIFEGDIILGEEALLTAPQLMSAGNLDRKWNNGVIPYVLDKNHPEYWDIYTAIDTLNQKSNLSLVIRTNETDYVEFGRTDGCASKVGRQIGKQIINVENCTVGSVMHEILHAAGFYHEQSRNDRDDFVTINWENIEEGKENNFKTYKERKLSGSDIGSYDYGSIMHYGKDFFSKNDKPTITPKDSSAPIGQRSNLSTGDLRGIRNMYPVKSKSIEPMVVTKPRIDTGLITKPQENPRLQTKPKLGGIIKP